MIPMPATMAPLRTPHWLRSPLKDFQCFNTSQAFASDLGMFRCFIQVKSKKSKTTVFASECVSCIINL